MDSKLDLKAASFVGNLYLLNRSKAEVRVIPELRFCGNSINSSYGVTYFVWFPDGTTIELIPDFQGINITPWGSERTTPKPLVMPGEGFSAGKFILRAGERETLSV